MVMPNLRTKSIGTKVSEDEYAQFADHRKTERNCQTD
jgi:hypothetical protein